MELVTKTFAPKIGTDKSAGIDLACKEITIKAGEIAKIPLETKVNFRCDLHPRSSLATKYGLWGQMGVIDEDYRGEICLVVLNPSKEDITIEDGTYVAQLLPYGNTTVYRHITENMVEKLENKFSFSQIFPKEVWKEKNTERYESWEETYQTERKGGFGSTDNK